MSNEVINARDAIGELFDTLKNAAQNDPTLGEQILGSVGQQVSFVGSDAVKAMDPCILAAKSKFSDFAEIFQGFSERELKKLAKNNKLATAEQLRNAEKQAQKKKEYVELIWKGARRQLRARSAAVGA